MENTVERGRSTSHCGSEFAVIVRAGVADQPRPVDRQRAQRDDDRRDPPVGDERAVDEPEERPDGHGEEHGEHRRCAEVVAEHVAGEVGADAGDRADRQVDVAGNDHQRLPGGHHGGHRHALGHAVEEASRQVVVDDQAEHDQRADDQQQQGQLLDPLGAHPSIHCVPRPRRPQLATRSLALARSQRCTMSPTSRGNRRCHDPLGIGLVVGEHAADSPFADDDDAVAHRQHLGEVGGDHDDGDAVAGEVVDELVHVGLGADVDAPSRLVEDGYGRSNLALRHVVCSLGSFVCSSDADTLTYLSLVSEFGSVRYVVITEHNYE